MRIIFAAFAMLALAGCVTASNTLTPDQVATFRLAKTDVLVPEGARVSWGDGEVAYANTKGVSPQDSGSVSQTPEGRAYVRAQVAAKLKGALERELSGQLAGSRPVRLEVRVQDVEIASVLQRIIVGGQHSLRADATLVDAKTGAVLLQFPAQTATSAAGQGVLGSMIDAAAVDAPIDRVVANYSAQYKRWLLRV